VLSRRLLSLLVVCATTPGVANAQLKNLVIPHCQAADSALGPKAGAFRGRVRARYDSVSKMITFVTELADRVSSLTASALVESPTWTGIPPIEITIYLRGKQVEQLVGLGRNPKATLAINDSSSLELDAVTLGRFVGPKAMIILPASILVSPATLLEMARARSVTIRVEQSSVSASAKEQRDLGALYAVLVCSRTG